MQAHKALSGVTDSQASGSHSPHRKQWGSLAFSTWRYGTQAAKGILLDAGRVCQDLYLACESIGCGTCAIAAYHQEELDRFLGLDGEDELVIYLAPVGKVEEA